MAKDKKGKIQTTEKGNQRINIMKNDELICLGYFVSLE
jgi:hypothetical protein